MKHLQNGMAIGLILMTAGCPPPVRTTPPPADAPAELVALSGASVMIGAGDIGKCGESGDELTAQLVDSVLRADSVAGVNDVVFTLGDNAYPDGTAADFARCFAPSWGDSSKLILKNIRPSPGNHEHMRASAAPYYQYFGDRAGDPGKGYYAYDHGEWRVVVLNSEIIVNDAFGPSERTAQEDWLKGELGSHADKLCTIAYWHHPRFSSGWHGGDIRLGPLWRLLYEGGVEIVLNGHDHSYERFAPMNAEGTADTTRGIVQFVVGTGGGVLRGFSRVEPNSVVQLQGHWGVLMLTLGKGEYRFAFLDTAGRVWDPGGGRCH